MRITNKNIPCNKVGYLSIQVEKILGSHLLRDVPSCHGVKERGRDC